MILQKNVNIGFAIEEKMRELKLTKTEFGKRIGIPQQNVNRILEKETIDTGKLVQISEALKFNFFSLYCDSSMNRELHSENPVAPESETCAAPVEADVASLSDKVKNLEALLAEKERIIQLIKLLLRDK